MERKAGWHPDSDRLGERYWNGAAWEGLRVRNRDLDFVVTVVIWVYIPVATVWIAASVGDFKRPSVGLRVASVVVGLLALILIDRALTQSITITPTAITARGILRTHRYRLDQIEDALLRETGLGKAWLTLRLRSEKLVALGNLDDRPERQRACVAEIRVLLFEARSLTAAPG